MEKLYKFTNSINCYVTNFQKLYEKWFYKKNAYKVIDNFNAENKNKIFHRLKKLNNYSENKNNYSKQKKIFGIKYTKKLNENNKKKLNNERINADYLSKNISVSTDKIDKLFV